MQSYPFGIPPLAGNVTSASFVASASFLAATINTASVAVNILGPQGPAGPNATITGATGPTGLAGSTGPIGLGVYLLSGSLATCIS